MIDLHGMAAFPGLINLHVHYGLVLPGALQARYQDESVAALAYRMAANARQALQAGVTTTRSVGERHGVDFALRAAIASGQTPGPRMFTGGAALAVTGGHGVHHLGLAVEMEAVVQVAHNAGKRLPGEMNEGTVASYREIGLMAEAGLSPMQVLMAATTTGAEVLQAGQVVRFDEPPAR
ncbi:MAG TPA: amidohydrolase family protein [Chloroflexota bacterium]